jgi:hypothetical protein
MDFNASQFSQPGNSTLSADFVKVAPVMLESTMDDHHSSPFKKQETPGKTSGEIDSYARQRTAFLNVKFT